MLKKLPNPNLLSSLKSFTLEEIAELTHSVLIGDPHYLISGAKDLKNATSQDASFLSQPRFLSKIAESKAGVIFVSFKPTTPLRKQLLVTENPQEAFQKLLELFYPNMLIQTAYLGHHPTACIHPSAKIGDNVTIGPYAIIDKEAIIGNHTHLMAGTFVGSESTIGENCIVYPRVVIRERCAIGNRVIIQPGAVIGSCGFGYTETKEGRHLKLTQMGSVIIEDDVEVGANTTIDRARFGATRIGMGSKLDNLVQIAHGVTIGPHNIIAAQSAIAGSSTTGKYVLIGGQVGIDGHLELGDYTMVGAKAGVSKSFPEGKIKLNGIPAQEISKYNRISVFWKNIETHLGNIEKRLQALENL